MERNPQVHAKEKRLCQDQPKQWHRLINPVLFAYREVPQESTGFSPFQLLYGRSVRGPGTILKELWTKEVNIPEVNSSYEYVTELRERLEDSLKLAQEELEKSQKRYMRHYDRKAKPRRLEVGDQVLILLPTDSNKLLMQFRGPYTVESRVGANDYRVKMGSKTKTYHVNMLKKYISREPEGNVVPVDDTDDTDDFRKLNKITEVDPEPMMTAEDLFRRLSGKKYLSKIDLTKGYWQIPVAPEDVHKTAFVTPDGQYEFTRMPFGMVNSGATLVRGLRKILEGMPGVGSYIDDIVIYSDSWEDHIRR